MLYVGGILLYGQVSSIQLYGQVSSIYVICGRHYPRILSRGPSEDTFLKRMNDHFILEIFCLATQGISCVATQEFEDPQDPVASQELVLCFSATPTNAGNLPVKKNAAHINPEAPGAPKVTKLVRGGHFVQRNLISASKWSKLFCLFLFWSKSNSLDTTCVGHNTHHTSHILYNLPALHTHLKCLIKLSTHDHTLYHTYHSRYHPHTNTIHAPTLPHIPSRNRHLTTHTHIHISHF